MKTLASLAAITILGLTSCSSTYQASMPYDDVYNSSKEKPAVATTAPPAQNPAPESYNQGGGNQAAYDNQQVAPGSNQDNQAQNNSGGQQSDKPGYTQSETYNSPDGNTYVTNNNFYNPDDYYDYGYTARIRRFDEPWAYHSYYDDYFTNLYWYNNDPMCYGTSIYMGYNWLSPGWGLSWGWDPFWYRPHYGFGLNYGWGYPYYADPCWGWGGYGSYYNGYYGGFYGGYYAGGYYPNDYYYNSRDNNSHFYGPREPRHSTNGHAIGGKSAGNYGSAGRMNLGERYESAVASGRIARPVAGIIPVKPSGMGNSVASPKNAGPASDNVKSNSVTGATRNTNVTSPAQGTVKRTEAPASVRNNTQGTTRNTPNVRPNGQAQPTQRNNNIRQGDNSQRVRPNTQARQQYSKPKNYYSPNYTKPKSSQEYVSPRTENGSSQQVIREKAVPNSSGRYYRQYQSAPSDQRSSGSDRVAPSRSESPRNSAPAMNNSGSERSSGGSRSSGSSGSRESSSGGSSGRRR